MVLRLHSYSFSSVLVPCFIYYYCSPYERDLHSFSYIQILIAIVFLCQDLTPV
jgi:hypothetical protein